MTRLLLTLRYNGAAFHGWQVQPNAVTVQSVLQDAIENLTGVRSGVIGCSRTDAGVSAEMFCCSFDTAFPLRGEKLCAALNAHLPREVAVYDVREVPADFHPRYHARGKRYVYRIWNGRQRHPLWEGRAWHINRPLDAEAMNATAALLVGRHDFAAFCSAGSSVEDTVRTVSRAEVTREDEMLTFTVEADGFLYNMVRIFIGTLVDVAEGRLTESDLQEALETGNREWAGRTAPPDGLILQRVFYGEEC